MGVGVGWGRGLEATPGGPGDPSTGRVLATLLAGDWEWGAQGGFAYPVQNALKETIYICNGIFSFLISPGGFLPRGVP